MERKPQRRRGQSFKQDYSSGSQPSLFEKMKARVTGQRLRQPSMIHEAGRDLIPPKDAAMEGRMTIVLDLDETLIYAREGPDGVCIICRSNHFAIHPVPFNVMLLQKICVEERIWTNAHQSIRWECQRMKLRCERERGFSRRYRGSYAAA